MLGEEVAEGRKESTTFVGSVLREPVVVVLVGLLFGVGVEFYVPPRVTILSAVYERRRSSALGATFAARNLGFAVLPAVAGAITAVIGRYPGHLVTVPAFAAALAGT
ncbi:hypothetical protein [Halegenticoccus soli]|uniref:hypothetical protein n=1 Tax=Halegenticoccus soli TaxID=1985678 RepID=UPI000C6E8364|nr:hypothetical protein [Halegenticoccus soli]